MTRDKARKILGNQPKWALTNCCRALQIAPWQNLPDDWRRLAALRALGYKVFTSIPKEFCNG